MRPHDNLMFPVDDMLQQDSEMFCKDVLPKDNIMFSQDNFGHKIMFFFLKIVRL